MWQNGATLVLRAGYSKAVDTDRAFERVFSQNVFLFSRTMSLPESFANPEDYFQEVLVFLRDYQHLYNFPNTKLLSSNCLEQISLEGLEDRDLFDEEVHLNEIAENNSALREILTKIERLRVNYEEIEVNEELTELDAPLSVKKKHEIIYLAQEIKETCDRVGCDTVVDFGSGLVRTFSYSKSLYSKLRACLARICSFPS